MSDKMFKTFRAEVRGVDKEDGVLDMFIPVSSMSMDRDGEIVEATAFKKTLKRFMEHPVLVSSHDYRDLTKQIGEWDKLKITENGLEGRPRYYVNQGNEEADWAYNLASKGRAAFSIGFIPKEWEDGDGEKTAKRTYKEVELLEISQVIIPSNREAIMGLRSKSADPIIKELCDVVEKDLPVVTKPEETGAMYRMPVPGEEGKHADHKIRTIDVSKEKGIKALYCIDDKKIITYMFDKEKWDSMKECQDWVKDHMGKREVSQVEIRDELDYIDSIIQQHGLSKETAFDAVDVAIRIMSMAWPYHKWESITLGENLTKEPNPVVFNRLVDEKRLPANDIAVNEKEIKPEGVKVEEKKPDIPTPTTEEIQVEIQNIKFGG